MIIENNVLVRIVDSDINNGQVVIPEEVISIGQGAFYNCCNVNSIVIHPNVTTIGPEAFYGCNKLTSIVIPDGVTVIRNGTFSGCKSLNSIDIPESVTTIESFAFYGCASLTSMVIPQLVTEIHSMAFATCTGLTSIIISKSVAAIGCWMFLDCDSLSTVHIDADNREDYERIIKLLPEELQQKIRINNQQSFVNEAKIILEGINRKHSFFSRHAMPDEVRDKILAHLAEKHHIKDAEIGPLIFKTTHKFQEKLNDILLCPMIH